MIIESQASWQKIKKPDFCYLCGHKLRQDDETNDDHCPPKKIFSKNDIINYPTLLKVHASCNSKWAVFDERYACLWSKISKRGKIENVAHKRVRMNAVDWHGLNRIIYNVPLDLLHYRVIRFCHAVIYGNYLSDGWKVDHYSPYVRLDPIKFTPVALNMSLYYKLSSQLVWAQKEGRVNGIVSYGRKFKYVDTWTHLDNGQDICIFAFDINNMAQLAPSAYGGINCVVGFYVADRPLNGLGIPRTMIECSLNDIYNPIKI